MKATVLSEYLLELVVREGDLDVYIGSDQYGIRVGAAAVRQDPNTGLRTITLRSIEAVESEIA